MYVQYRFFYLTLTTPKFKVQNEPTYLPLHVYVKIQIHVLNNIKIVWLIGLKGHAWDGFLS